MERKTLYWLGGIFLAVLALRLLFAFLTPNLTYESYFHLRQVENILQVGTPAYQDALSYGGRALMFLPFFHYFMALFGLFLPLTLVAKLLPNLLISLLVPLVFLISERITKNETSSLLAALIAGLLPILYKTNSFSPDVLFLPLMLLLIYFFLRIQEKKFLWGYIILFPLLTLTSSATSLIIIGLGVYLLLYYLEERKIQQEETELMLFSLFSFIWIQLLFFKKLLLMGGMSFMWQNVPSAILENYFPQVSLFSALLLVSVVPFLSGIYVVYKSLFKIKNRNLILLISLAMATSALAWLRFVRFELSLSLFALILAILFASFYHNLQEYFSNLKWLKKTTLLLIITLTLLLITMFPPSLGVALQQQTPSDKEVQAFAWLANNTNSDEAIAASVQEGHLVTYYGKRANLMDDQFSLIPNIEKRYQDANDLYTTKFQTVALSITDKYKIKYIVLTPTAKSKFELNKLNYLTSDCFKKVYDDEVKIYLVKCELREAQS